MALVNGNAAAYLKFTMHKTKDELELPLNQKAIQLIPAKTFDEDRLLPVYSNQPLNRYLQKAAGRVNIQKSISFHLAIRASKQP